MSIEEFTSDECVRTNIYIFYTIISCIYDSWLYNLFSSFINKALRNALQKQVRNLGCVNALYYAH